MFKSVFSKYVTAFMLIILVSFLMVLIITATAIGRFSNDVKQDSVMNTADTSKLYFSSLLYSSGVKDLSALDERGVRQKGQVLCTWPFCFFYE